MGNFSVLPQRKKPRRAQRAEGARSAQKDENGARSAPQARGARAAGAPKAPEAPEAPEAPKAPEAPQGAEGARSAPQARGAQTRRDKGTLEILILARFRSILSAKSQNFRASGGAAQAAGPGGFARHADFNACGGQPGPRRLSKSTK